MLEWLGWVGGAPARAPRHTKTPRRGSNSGVSDTARFNWLPAAWGGLQHRGHTTTPGAGRQRRSTNVVPHGSQPRAHGCTSGNQRREDAGHPHSRACRQSGSDGGLPQTLKQACSQRVSGSAMCVQRFDDSLSSAIHITYRISLRSSSLQ